MSIWITEKINFRDMIKRTFAPEIVRVGMYIVSFSAVLIASKTMAMRLAPNPGYVVALLLIAPIFVFYLNKYNKVPDNISIKAGFSMLFFLVLLMLVINVESITD